MTNQIAEKAAEKFESCFQDGLGTVPLAKLKSIIQSAIEEREQYWREREEDAYDAGYIHACREDEQDEVRVKGIANRPSRAAPPRECSYCNRAILEGSYCKRCFNELQQRSIDQAKLEWISHGESRATPASAGLPPSSDYGATRRRGKQPQDDTRENRFRRKMFGFAKSQQASPVKYSELDSKSSTTPHDDTKRLEACKLLRRLQESISTEVKIQILMRAMKERGTENFTGCEEADPPENKT